MIFFNLYMMKLRLDSIWKQKGFLKFIKYLKEYFIYLRSFNKLKREIMNNGEFNGEELSLYTVISNMIHITESLSKKQKYTFWVYPNFICFTYYKTGGSFIINFPDNMSGDILRSIYVKPNISTHDVEFISTEYRDGEEHSENFIYYNENMRETEKSEQIEHTVRQIACDLLDNYLIIWGNEEYE